MNINTCNKTDLGTTTTPSHTERCTIKISCGATWFGLSPLILDMTCDGTRLVNKKVTKTLYTCKVFVPGPCAGYWKTIITVQDHVWFEHQSCIPMQPSACACPPGYVRYDPPQLN